MTPENFCYWLQGRAELVDATPTDAEWAAIKQHLGLVLTKVTPQAPDNPTIYRGPGIRTAELRSSDLHPGIPTLTC